MTRGQNPLFTQRDLLSFIKATEAKMLNEIDNYESNRLLNSSVDDLLEYFSKKYAIAPVRILEDRIRLDQHDEQIDVSRDLNRAIHDRSRPFYVPGTVLTLYVAFDGDPEVFKYAPSSTNYNPPTGVVREYVLELSIHRTNHDVEAARRELEDLLGRARRYIDWAAKDLESFNASLRDKARNRIESRREKLLKDQGLAATLGFPLKQRSDNSVASAIPTVRKKLPLKPPAASSKPYTPEPRLEMAEYDAILTIMTQTAAMLERSPKAFQNMDEEELRDQFLVPLNSHYEGQATGETFNFSGKTDILIRDGDRNVFIAECKIWRGPKGLSEAVDQLLGYAQWRDTKTAILLFNRNKNLSAVLTQIPEVIRAHPCFKRTMEHISETGFRFVVSHPDDRNREIVLTVLVFEVPA